MRSLKGDIIAASGAFIGGSGLEWRRPLSSRDTTQAGSPETLTYLHPDHLGTPKFGTNAGGTQVWSWAPDAFGNGAPSGSVTVNIRMPGQYFDAESGLFYNWNRYYNPAIGRYISSDPIGLEGGINTFLYAAASPVMNIDPDGQFAILLPLFSGASVSLPSAATIAAYGVAIADGLAKATAGIILMSSLTGDTPDAGVCEMAVDDKPSAADCNKALKLLKAVVRLANDLGIRLTEDAKNKLRETIANGTITSGDLPPSIAKEMPDKLRGKTLNEIRKICGKQ